VKLEKVWCHQGVKLREFLRIRHHQTALPSVGSAPLADQLQYVNHRLLPRRWMRLHTILPRRWKPLHIILRSGDARVVASCTFHTLHRFSSSQKLDLLWNKWYSSHRLWITVCKTIVILSQTISTTLYLFLLSIWFKFEMIRFFNFTISLPHFSYKSSILY